MRFQQRSTCRHVSIFVRTAADQGCCTPVHTAILRGLTPCTRSSSQKLSVCWPTTSASPRRLSRGELGVQGAAAVCGQCTGASGRPKVQARKGQQQPLPDCCWIQAGWPCLYAGPWLPLATHQWPAGLASSVRGSRGCVHPSLQIHDGWQTGGQDMFPHA